MTITLADFSSLQGRTSQWVRIKNDCVVLSRKSRLAQFLIRLCNSMPEFIPWIRQKKEAEQAKNAQTAAALMQALTAVYGSDVRLSDDARVHEKLMNGITPLTVRDIDTITIRITRDAHNAALRLYCHEKNINDDATIKALSVWVSPEYQHIALDDWKNIYDAIASGTLTDRLIQLFTAFTESLALEKPHKNMLAALCRFSDWVEVATSLQQEKSDYILQQVIQSQRAEMLLNNLTRHPCIQEMLAAHHTLTVGQDNNSRHIRQLIKTLMAILNACATTRHCGLAANKEWQADEWADYMGISRNHDPELIDSKFYTDLHNVLASAQA